MERERLWQQIWSDCPGIGWQRLRQLHRHCGNFEQAWGLGPGELRSLPGIGDAVARAVEVYRQRLQLGPCDTQSTHELRRRWRQARCLLPGDPAFPSSLMALDRPPMQLHWEGQGWLWAHLRQRGAIAVVGTRHPSRHGEAMARRVGQALALAGWPVLSGLAEGIDAAAHGGCLEAGGRPIGVIGTGLDRIYPRHHGRLQGQVAQRGLLISELARGSAVRPGHFAARNRLLVSMAQAVVLVECPTSSGAMISAELAWSQGKPLWVVPGDAGRASAAGSNAMLARGASLLLDPGDLMHQLGPGPLRRTAVEGRTETPGPPGTPSGHRLLQREACLLAALGSGATLEDLCQRLREGPGTVGQRLLELEQAGLIRGEPGLWWSRR